MGERHIIFGPPGTGKTTTLLNLMEEELKRVLLPSRIAFVAFTRAAKKEALARATKRFGIEEDEMPWVRTIHSAAFRMLGLTKERVMSREHWKKFAAAYNLDLSEGEQDEDEPAAPVRHSPDDDLRYAWEWLRQRGLDVDSVGYCPVAVRGDDFVDYVKSYTNYKHKNGLYDFTDMLVGVLEQDAHPDVRVAFLDEAQDLSPLQQQVFEHLFGQTAEVVYIAGDDDQAIYNFQGADPEWLIGQHDENGSTVLGKSWRLPAAIHAMAHEIIRQNQNRVSKEFTARNDRGSIDPEVGQHEIIPWIGSAESALLLCRNRMFFPLFADRLFSVGIPYMVEGAGAKCPYKKTSVHSALTSIARLLDNGWIVANELASVLKLIPSKTKDGAVNLPHGAKVAVQRREKSRLAIPDMLSLGLSGLVNRFRNEGPVGPLDKLDDNEKAYWQLVYLGHRGFPKPKIVISTIHGAKGREADRVLVCPDMSRPSFEEYMNRDGCEGENRVAYVAVTRAKEALGILRPATHRSYDYPMPRRAA